MPELPEVETVRRGLERLVVGKTIEQVQVRYAKMIGTGVDSFIHDLPGQTIEKIGRRGKYLLFYLTGGVLISHLRMEGKYLFYPDAVPERKHAHVFFEMTDGGTLVYEDVRKFGTMELLRKDQLEAYFAARKLGPEPTEADFLLPPFAAALSRSKKPIKPYLLEQTLVVGLGNIYVDEALWRARIHPARPAASLKPAEVKRLREQIIEVLQLGIEKRGSTIRTYRNALGEDGTMQDFLQVYGKPGQPCARCGSPIEKIKLSGRGTHLCPHCQKAR
ncbi:MULTISPECIES: DNA-formamidopyrimidine glycosylase [Streptococcus]|uniref:DNA-formamidopyrimidine glycosylase n=1 Tax=Streptococcus TaxID=1301 RepID=UPI0008A1BFB9|nr:MULTISPECIES: DNA-formamidopyrimidine glycosylase [Streptococcus]MBS6244849.1 DNA-formamidopyrimidine glycosylase [Streptococcus sp.]MBW7664351.1 DNA-formamidopyrimidine glycosylase [Streptococcus gordonii]OFU73424.1 DNA-formamidopyrimidine glycosylase [Streptococcus sp. HMSC10A01]